MWNALKANRDIVCTIALLVPVFGMHTPVSNQSVSLLAAIAVLAIEWKRIEIDAELKRILVMFLVYLAAFTALSADHSRSLKGSYDILRGLVHFPVALLLAQYARRPDVSILLKVCATSLLLAQFLFPQKQFFGFYVNPNNAAVMLVFLVSLSLPSLRSSDRHPVETLIGGLGLLAGLYLLVLTNSRAAWLACAVAAGALVICMKSLSARLKIGLLVLVAGALIAALYFLNWKGVGLRLRDVIWEALFRETLNNSPWLGYGINYAKELMPALNVPFQTTHNIFLELFVSSGFVGLAIALFLIFRLTVHYRSFCFDNIGLFYSGMFGLLAFLVMDQFDLKFASYRFFGSHCFFLGLIYAHRRIPAVRTARARDDVRP